MPYKNKRNILIGKKTLKFLWLFLLIFFIFVPALTFAVEGVPKIISYQGRLTDSAGNLLGGSGINYYFKFSIWDNPTVDSGTQFWPISSSSITTSTVKEGVFNINIGDTASGYPDALTYDFYTNKDIYLQVEVSSNGSSFETLSPRQRIAASGFAINTETVSGKLRVSTSSDYTFQVTNEGSGLANLQIQGQVRVGGYSSSPTNIGGGSLYYNTNTGNLFVWNAATSTPQWIALGGGGGGTTDLQGAYNLGNAITTTDSRNILFTLSNTATDSNFIVNIATSSTGIFQIQSSSTPIFTISQTNVTSTAALNWNIQGAATLSTTTINGLLTANNISSSNATISGGTINSTSIGNTTSSTAIFTIATTTKLFVTGSSTLGTVISGIWQGTPIQDTSISSAATWNAKITTTSLSAVSPLSYNNTTGVFSMPTSTASQNGFLLASDWSTFNTKVSSSTQVIAGTGMSGGGQLTGNVTLNNAGVLSLTAGTGMSVSNSTGTITITNISPHVTSTINAFTSNNYTLQGTAGQISVANSNGTSTWSLATTTITAGTYTTPNITIDAYGRLTSATSTGGGFTTTTINGLSSTAYTFSAGTNMVITTSSPPATVTFTVTSTPSFTILTVNTSSSLANTTFTNATGTTLGLGTLTLTNALGVSYGGTGTTTAPGNNNIFIGNGTNFVQTTIPNCSATTEKLIYNQTTKVWTCETDATLGGGAITGSGNAGEVTYFNSASNVTSTPNFAWNNSTNILQIIGQTSSTNAYFLNATTTNLVITGITNSLLATDNNGKVIATTTIPGGGITSFNGSTSSTQNMATAGATGGFSWTTSNGIHTLTIATSSVSAIGLLTSTDWNTFNSKLSSAPATTTINAYQSPSFTLQGTSGQILVANSNGTSTWSLATTTITAGTYTTPNITIDAYGRLTSATSTGGGFTTTTINGLSSTAYTFSAGTNMVIATSSPPATVTFTVTSTPSFTSIVASGSSTIAYLNFINATGTSMTLTGTGTALNLQSGSLSVQGTIYASSTITPALAFTLGDINQNLTLQGATTTIIATSSNSIVFTTAGNERMRIINTGKILINTTATTTGQLNIIGTASGGATVTVAGIYQESLLNPSVSGNYQSGNRHIVNVAATASSTMVGEFVRMIDNTGLNSTVRAMELQAWSGTSTQGVNTGLFSAGRTFGVQAVSNGTAGGGLQPAAFFGELTGSSTVSQVMRLYSKDIALNTQDFAQFYQELSNFEGTGLRMEFAQNGGSFTGNFLYLKNSQDVRFVVNATGTVMIGTSTPYGISNLVVCAQGNCTLPAATNTVAIFASTDGNPTGSSIVAHGTITQGASDVGEYVYIEGASSDYEAGDLLAVSTATSTRFTKTTLAYQANLAGIVSKTAGFIGGGELMGQPDTVIMTLAGRVPVKVNSENGPITLGDLITASSKTGFGMKATLPGRTIGVALESFNATSTDATSTIMVLINPSYSFPGAADYQTIQGGGSGEMAMNTFTFDSKLTVHIATLVAGKIIVEDLTVGSEEKPAGITIYDIKTKQPYCILIEDGIIKSLPGKCSDVLPTINSASVNTTSGTGEPTPQDNGAENLSPTEVIPESTSTLSETTSSSVELSPELNIINQPTSESPPAESIQTTEPTPSSETAPVSETIPTLEPTPTPEPTSTPEPPPTT